MGICASQPTDPDEDENEYSLSMSGSRRNIDDPPSKQSEAGLISSDDDGNSIANKKKSKTNKKYPWVVSEHDVKDVYLFFEIEKELGRGASCRVLKVKEKSSNKLYAMKEMRRDDKWNPMLFEQECNILSKLSGHKNILHYEDCWIDNKNFYVLTSLCTGGELFGIIYPCNANMRTYTS